MTHIHITAWLLTVILFFIAIKAKNNILQQIVRLGYILIIFTGGWMLFNMSSYPLVYIVKTLLGIWVIVAMEMILTRGKKGKSTRALWVQFVVVFVITILLGLHLPFGFQIF